MKFLNFTALGVGVCLLFAEGMIGQTQNSIGTQPADPNSKQLRTAEPDSATTGSSVGAEQQAVVPRLMKFNGALHDAAGKPLTGPVDVTFSFYSTEAGGDALWFETQSVQADELGRYTALLGAMHSDGLPAAMFTSGEVRWLGIQVGHEPDQQPRVLLVSVPYALKAGDAETLGGKPASAYVLADPQSGTTSTAASSGSTTDSAQSSTSGAKQKTAAKTATPLTPCATITSNGAAALNSIALFTTACNLESSNMTQVNGNLGFGVATPQVRLHIYGPTQIAGDARYNFILGDSTPAAAGVGGGILFSGYYKNTTSKAGFAAIRGVKENDVPGNFASALIFSTQVNLSSQTERMRISSAGNIGIGTSAPVAKLDVAGNINASGDLGVAGAITSNGLMVMPNVADTVAPGCTADICFSTNILAGYTGMSGGNMITAGVTGATISGGGGRAGTNHPNLVTDAWGTVGGGYGNQAGDNAGFTYDKYGATVGGGVSNAASGRESIVGGGSANTASATQATVGGGDNNNASGAQSTIAGGKNNAANSIQSTVSGGQGNSASATQATVSGGVNNAASADSSTVSGGQNNTASGTQATVSGGYNNTASGGVSMVPGGANNIAGGLESFAAG